MYAIRCGKGIKYKGIKMHRKTSYESAKEDGRKVIIDIRTIYCFSFYLYSGQFHILVSYVVHSTINNFIKHHVTQSAFYTRVEVSML